MIKINENSLKELIAFCLFLKYYQTENDLDLTKEQINSMHKSWEEGVLSPHSGDCTKQAHPCLKCITETFKDEVDLILEVLSA